MSRIKYINSKPIRKDYLLYLYAIHVFLVYLDGFVKFPTILINVTQYLFIALGLVRIIRNKMLRVTPYMEWGLCFIIVMLLSLVYAPNANDGMWLSIIPFSIQFLVYIVLFDNIKTLDDCTWVMHLYMIAGLLFSLVALIFYTGDLFSGRRFGFSLGLNPNEIMVQMILPASFAFFMAYKDEHVNYKYVVSFALCALVLLSTGSKKSVLIALYVIIFLLLKSERKSKIKTIVGLIVAGLLAYYALFNVDFLYNSLGRRVEALFSLSNNVITNANTTDYTRHMMRRDAFRFFLDSPIWGNGCESFRFISSYGTYSHNNYAEILCSYGAIGGVAYYILPITYLIKSGNRLLFKKEKNIYLCLIVGLIIVYLLIDWGAVTTISRYNMFLFSFCSALYSIQRIVEYAEA